MSDWLPRSVNIRVKQKRERYKLENIEALELQIETELKQQETQHMVGV